MAHVDALAVVLVLLMALPAATCRRAPVASAVVALTAALGAAALGYPPTSGWFAALLIAAAAVYLTDRRRAWRSGAFALIGDILASFAAADATGERLSAFQLVANVCVIGVPLLLADLLREQRRLLAQVREQSRPARAAARGRGRRGRGTRAGADRSRRPRRRRQRPQRDRGAGRSAGRRSSTRIPTEARATFERIAQMAREALSQTRAAVRGMRDAVADDATGRPAGARRPRHAARRGARLGRRRARPPPPAGRRAERGRPGRDVPDRPGGADERRALRTARPGRRLDPPHQRRGVHRRPRRRRAAREPAGQGSGITGMRERAALVGGRLEAGPSPDGLGWRVHAVLPARAPGRGGRAMTAIRVLLADDQAVVRRGLRTILEAESDLEVVGEAADGVEAVALAPPPRRRPRADGRPHAAHGRPRGDAPARPPRHRRPDRRARRHDVRPRRRGLRRAARRRGRLPPEVRRARGAGRGGPDGRPRPGRSSHPR